jgi:hypothetical protein
VLQTAHAAASDRSGVRQSCSRTMIALAISIGTRPGVAFCAASAATITAKHDATHHAVSRRANHGGSRSARDPPAGSKRQHILAQGEIGYYKVVLDGLP